MADEDLEAARADESSKDSIGPKLGDVGKAKAMMRKKLHERVQAKGEGGRSEAGDLAVPRPFIHTATVDSTEWTKLISVDTKGRLTALGVAGGPRYHYFEVEIDGEIVVSDYLAGTSAPNHVNNGIGVDLPFSKGLVVRARDDPEGSSIAKYWVAWVAEPALPVSEERYVYSRNGFEYVFGVQRYRRADGSTYAADLLLGPRRVSEVRLDRDWVPMEGPRGDGYVLLRGRPVVRDLVEHSEEALGEVRALVRVAGRRSPVSEVRLAEAEQLVRVSVPAPGEYSIAPVLEGHSNVPAFFTVL